MIKYLYLGKKFIFLILGVDPRVLCMLSMFWTTELLIEPLTLTPSLYHLVSFNVFLFMNYPPFSSKYTVLSAQNHLEMGLAVTSYLSFMDKLN